MSPDLMLYDLYLGDEQGFPANHIGTYFIEDALREARDYMNRSFNVVMKLHEEDES